MSAAKPLIVVGLPLPVFPVQEVTSLRKTGDTSGLTGDITLDPGAGIAITETGHVFTISATGGVLQDPAWIVREKHTAEIDGVTASFTLAYLPVAGSESVYLGGLIQDNPDDYSISGSVITFLSAPAIGDKLLITYETNAVAYLTNGDPTAPDFVYTPDGGFILVPR